MALRAFWGQFMISLHFQYTFYYLLSFLFFIFAAKYDMSIINNRNGK